MGKALLDAIRRYRRSETTKAPTYIWSKRGKGNKGVEAANNNTIIFSYVGELLFIKHIPCIYKDFFEDIAKFIIQT